MGEPRVPAIGSIVTLPTGPDDDAVDYEVMPPCEDQHSGHWWCVLHRYGPTNNLETANHIASHGDGVCEIVWVCHQHGPEGD